MFTFAAVALLAATLSGSGHGALAGALTTVSPSGASPSVTINISGTGFDATASNNEVAFVPATGSVVTARGSSIVMVNAGTGTRRVSVAVPAGLQTGRVALRVTNLLTNETIEGLSIDIVGIGLNDVSSAPRGSSNLSVRITGTSNSRFATGSSRAAFGAGITVHSTTVESATSLVASISVAATASLGARSVGVISPTQTATLASAFSVTDVGTPTNRNPTANAGGSYPAQTGVSITLTGTGSDPDTGDTLTYGWSFGDGSKPMDGAEVSHTYATAGTYNATLTVKDGRGGTATSTAQVTVTSPPPPPPLPNNNPSITSSAITAATEGQPYAYDVEATDPDLNDVLTYTLAQFPMGMTIDGTTGKVAWTPGEAGQVPVTVRVSDGKGGSAEQSFTIATAAANRAPAINSAPVTAASEGQAYAYDVDATDDIGDSLTYSLTLFPSGMEINPSTGIIAWTPTSAHVPSAAVTVSVSDSKGGTASQSFTISVAAAPPPNQQPVITSIANTSATEGQSYSYDVSARDDDATDTLLYALNEAPSGMTIDAGSGVIAWTPAAADVPSVPVTVLISDGRDGSATQSFTITVAAAPVGRGVIAGRVFDDATGLPLEGANIQLLSVDGNLPDAPTLQTLTDFAGRFRLSAAPGLARLRVTKPVHTGAERTVRIVGGKRVDLFDARLTPLDVRINAVASVRGDTAISSGGDLRLAIAAAAMPEDAGVRLTRVSAQGLKMPLPLGSSPVAAVDVFPGAMSFSSAALLSVPVPAGLPTDGMVSVVLWDDAAGAWVAGGTAQRSTDGKELQAALSRAGQHAFVLADVAPGNPPPPIIGEPLPALLPRPPPADLGVTITPSPRVLFAQPGARSRVGVLAASSTPLPSGTPFLLDLVESYTFSGGGGLHLPPAVQRLALYGFPAAAAASTLRSELIATPSRQFAPFALRVGAIDLAVRVPPDPAAPLGTVIGGAGGIATAATGERASIPAGAAVEDLPVVLTRIDQVDFPLAIPGGLSFLRALTFDLHGGTLGLPSTLSIPAPAGLGSDDRILVVQLVEADGQSGLALVAVGAVQGTELVTVVDPRGDGSLRFPGIRGEGRYAFLKADQPIGFLTGLISGDGGAALSGALVRVDSLGLLALTDGEGRYVLASPLGEARVTARKIDSGDTAGASATLTTAGAVSTLPVSLGATPPLVVAVAPVNGTAAVPLSSAVRITFSEPVDPASITPDAFVILEGAAATAGTVSLAPGNTVLTFRPTGLLRSQATYQVRVAGTIRDLAGNPIGTPFLSQFSTVDLTAPPPPAAGAIAATIPDANGTFTITGSQGTADPGGLVLVRNLRTGATTTLSPNANGGFSGTIAALRTDRIEITITDAAGNKTTLPLPAFRNADGSVVVGAAGAHLEADGGVAVIVPAGALPDGTIVRIAAVSAEQLPVPAPTDYPFVGGVRIDLGGVVPLSELKVAVSAPPNATAADQVVVARAIPFLNGLAWTVEERARFADGKYTTASWPFVGVVNEGTYAFLQPPGACTSYVSVRYHFVTPVFLMPVGLPFVVPTSDREQTTVPARCGSELVLTVFDPDTQAALRQVSFFSPAARDDISFPLDVLTDDTTPVTILSINNPTDQAATTLEVRFSKALDRASVANFIVKDSAGAEVAGTFEFLDHASRIVFQPLSPFRQGEQYTLIVAGVKDQAGHPVDAQPMTFTPYGPRSISSLRQTPDLEAALEKCGPTGCTTSALDVAVIGNTMFVANGIRTAVERYRNPDDPKRLLALDITDPFHPALIGWTATGTNPRALAAVRGVSLSTAAGPFNGDLLLVAGGGRVAGGELNSKLEVWDATACGRRPVVPNTNCFENALKGFRLLSTPSQVAVLPGVPPDSGVPLQMTFMHQRAVLPSGGGEDPNRLNDVLLAYVLVVPIGIELVNVAQAFNMPTPNQSALGPDGVSPGDFTDISVLKNRVVAVGVTPTSNQPRVSVLTAQLGLVVELPPPTPAGLSGFAGAARLGTFENAVFDLDNDGRVGVDEQEDHDEVKGSDELFDLALVSSGPLSDGCGAVTPCGELYVLDLSAHTDLAHAGGPRILDRIPLAGAPFSIAIDGPERLAYVELRGRGIATVDLGFLLKILRGEPAGNGLIDANHDGQDDRVVSIFNSGGRQQDIVISRIKIDANRGLAFVNGATTGVEIIQIANKANELALDFTEEVTAGNKDLEKEKAILLGVITRAVQVLRSGTSATPTTAAMAGLPGDAQISVLEQGSGSCFWRTTFDTRPDSTCPAFQPGTSDHDFEVFVDQRHVPAAQRLLNAFIDSKPPGLDQLGDLSLFAMPREPFAAAELLNGTPLYGAGVSDATGDLGMGRQSLLLLWLLEGAYVTGYQGTLPDLDDILALLKQKQQGEGDPACAGPAAPASCPVIAGEPSGIPRLEGYEWSLLQEFNLYKTGAILRVRGGCEETNRTQPVNATLSTSGLGNDPLKNFNERDVLAGDCGDELHSVAKAAIRTVFARIVADTRANPLVLDIDPAHQDDLGAYRRNACFEGPFTTANAAYEQVPCTGFEHYIATVAVRAAQRGWVFSDADLPQIYEFYCMKVDKCPVPGVNSDADADRFIRGAVKFINDSQGAASTFQIYKDTVGLDIKKIGDVPILLEGPGGGPGGIASICEGLFSRHGNSIAPFLPEGGLALTPITAASPRSVLRLCNYLIVWLKTNGDSTEDVPLGLDQHHVQFDGSGIDDLKHRLGTKHYVDWKLQVRALNLGARAVNVNLSLYEGNGTDRDDYNTPFPSPPGPTSGKTIPVALAGGDTQVIAQEPVPDQPDPDKKRAIFSLLFNLKRPELAPNSARALTFFLDPERTVPEADKKDNQAGFFYYVLDTTEGGTGPSTPPKPVAPIENVDPDPLAIPKPRLAFDFTVRGRIGGGFVGGKVISVGLDEDVTLKYEVRNLGPVKLTDVSIYVRRDLRGREVRVITLPELAPAGEPNDHILLSDPAVFTPTDDRTYQLAAHVEATDSKGNRIGPVYDYVSITGSDDLSLAKVRLYDASALAESTHPLSRFLANTDDAGHAIPLKGAVTDGDELGAGGRIRVEIEGLRANVDATVTLKDPDFPDATDGLGWLESGDNLALQTVTVTFDSSQRAVVYYRPPAVFVRDAHRAVDIAKQERAVTVSIVQPGVGGGRKRILLRRPPVFLVHGLFSTTKTWNDLQPLVPAGGLLPGFASTAGFDGRFDVFAVGTPNAHGTIADESKNVRAQMKLALMESLPGYAIGRVDVIGHSMGALIIRQLINDFVTSESPWGGTIKLPFRKLIAMDTPFAGTPLADKIVEIRSRLPVRVNLGVPTDLLDVVTSFADGATPQIAPEVKVAAKLESCALIVQSAGLTPGFFIRGAMDDLVAGSPAILRILNQGIVVPSHHIIGVTTPPDVGISLVMEALWLPLGYFCNLTPDETTGEATKFNNAVTEALAFIAQALVGKVKLPSLSIGAKMPWAKVSESTKMVLTRVGPVAQFAKEQAENLDPTVIFPSENDRAVQGGSQRGGLPIGDTATTNFDGRIDHNTILNSPGVPVSACGDLSSITAPTRLEDLNGDGTFDITCKLIFLLEAAPTSPYFFRSIQP